MESQPIVFYRSVPGQGRFKRSKDSRHLLRVTILPTHWGCIVLLMNDTSWRISRLLPHDRLADLKASLFILGVCRIGCFVDGAGGTPATSPHQIEAAGFSCQPEA